MTTKKTWDEPRCQLISKRTVAIFGLLLVLLIGVGWAVQRRDVRCTALRNSMARSAPWFSAKGGAHGFECGDYDHIPLLDKAIGAGWFLSLIAVLRSLIVDIQAWRMRQRIAFSDPPDTE